MHSCPISILATSLAGSAWAWTPDIPEHRRADVVGRARWRRCGVRQSKALDSSMKSWLWPIAALALALLGGCAPPEESGRVVLIGIDGATMRVMAPLLEAGELPNLATLAEQGVIGALHPSQPLSSPRIWNTMATGKEPEQHGILGFALQEGAGTKRLYYSTDRKVHALWNIVSDAGLSVAVVNFWNTFPPDKIDGVMVSDHVLAAEVQRLSEVLGTAPAPAAATVYPEKWAERVQTLLRSSERATDFPDPLADPSTLPPWNQASGTRLTRRSGEDDALVRIACAIEEELRPKLLMLLLPGIDRVSHHLWGTIEPPELYPEHLRPEPEQRAAGAAALRDYYRYTDALIGTLLARYSPDDLVMVVSDHGFEAGTPMPRLTGTHDSARAAAGVLLARGRGIERRGAAQRIDAADVTPTILSWLGLPVAADMSGACALFLDAAPTPPIGSYEGAPIERVPAASSGAEERVLERLRSLGYLD